MSAATTDRNTTSRPGLRLGVGIAATVLLLAGCLAGYDSDGYLTHTLADTVSFAGVAQETVDNSSGDDGDETGVLLLTGCYRMASASLSRSDTGCRLYLSDNQTVVKAGHASLTTAGKWIYVGIMEEYISASEVWVRIEPHHQPQIRQYTIKIAGTNAAVLDLSSVATDFGGTNFYVSAVQVMHDFTTSGGAADKILVITTNYTVASGVITTVGDLSAKTLVISFTGYLK